MPTRPTPFSATEDITFELVILEQIATHRRPLWDRNLPANYAATLKGSELWEVPVDYTEPVSRTSAWKAAALASLIALAPLAWLPTQAEPAVAQTELRVGLSVIDARTGKPLAGARVLNEHGQLLGTTDGKGKLTLTVPSGASDRFVIERQGYRSFPIIRTQLRDQNLIAMLPAPGAQPAHPATPAPTPKPTHHATPAPTAKPTHHATPAPKPTHHATPAPKPTHHATPAPKPTHHATPAPKPTHHPKPLVHPVPKATAHPTPAPSVTPASPSVKPTVSPEFGNVAPRARTYTVRKGDSLWSIAKREYGDAHRWRTIYRANRSSIHKASVIQPGMILKLPKSLRHVTPGGVVMVHRGDSLWALAQRYLGDGNRWPEIYEANRSRIHNPRVLHPGQRLHLPHHARRSRTVKRHHH